MKQIIPMWVGMKLSHQPIVSELQHINNAIGKIGFQDTDYRWYIACIQNVLKPELPQYIRIFEEYLGKPKKDFDEPVLFEINVPRFFVDFINKMNGFLFGGICINKGYMTLEQVVEAGVIQRGGCLNPPINLFDSQSFYGKSSDKDMKIELARICPYTKEDLATIEYMVCFRK